MGPFFSLCKPDDNESRDAQPIKPGKGSFMLPKPMTFLSFFRAAASNDRAEACGQFRAPQVDAS